MSKPAAEFRAIREEELHDGYTYSGGAYGRRVHYLPPGPAAVRRCGQGIGTWNIAGRVVNSLESTISFGTLESGSWGPPPSMARSMDDGRGVPVSCVNSVGVGVAHDTRRDTRRRSFPGNTIEFEERLSRLGSSQGSTTL